MHLHYAGSRTEPHSVSPSTYPPHTHTQITTHMQTLTLTHAHTHHYSFSLCLPSHIAHPPFLFLPLSHPDSSHPDTYLSSTDPSFLPLSIYPSIFLYPCTSLFHCCNASLSACSPPLHTSSHVPT